MQKLIVANWKMNPDSPEGAARLAKEIEKMARNCRHAEVVVAPPFPFLTLVQRVIKKAKLGAQDVFWKDRGPYTGEVSWRQLRYLKVQYAIVGHSERRRWLNETDEMVNKKVVTALKAGLNVILCVGEPLAVRKKGIASAKRFVKNQLQKGLCGVSKIEVKSRKLVIAYEPVWAIGTDNPDNPKDSAEIAEFIKNQIQDTKFPISVLYGGSVTANNAPRIFKYREIDGVLVGGASLKPNEFRGIIMAVSD